MTKRLLSHFFRRSSAKYDFFPSIKIEQIKLFCTDVDGTPHSVHNSHRTLYLSSSCGSLYYVFDSIQNWKETVAAKSFTAERWCVYDTRRKSGKQVSLQFSSVKLTAHRS